MRNYTKFLNKHKLQIITSIILSAILCALLGYISRPYPAIGGEDIIPIMVVIYWLIKADEYNEKER